MVQSKGVVLHGGKRAEIVTAEVGDPDHHQVLVRVHAVGLCGSDLALYDGSYEGPKNYPIYFGHEWSGTVEAVGEEVTRVQPGDKVTGDCSIYCGECELCGLDRNLCQHIDKYGITTDGASRQYLLQDEKYIYRADPAADLDLVALTEPLAVGLHAVRRVHETRPNLAREKVLVLGGGTIGFSCFFALKYIEGCEHVELFDLVESRIEKARVWGAAGLTDVAADEAGDESYSAMYSGRGYDAIFESTGSARAFQRAVALLRPLGTIMALGFIPSVEVPLKQVTLKAARVMGSMGGTGEFPRVLEFIREHPEVARQLITHRFPYTEVGRAFEAAADRRGSMKVLIHF